jgi:antitoxin VapB
MSVTTKLFLSNTTQAVRLPKSVAFGDDVTEVEIVVVGDARLIRPVGAKWDVFWSSEVHVSPEYLLEREQPDELPERPWVDA